MKTVIATGAVLAAFMSAAPAFAQDGYMFGMPRTTLTLRAGAARPAADSEVFRFFTDQLTLDRTDFASATFGVDLGMRVHPRVDVVLSAGFAHSSNDSEFRNFVEDPNDQPIRQTTELSRTPVTAGLKLHLLPRGRSLGRLAFVPNRVSPYVGGGVGVLWYQLEQDGDFVDFETLDIFTDHFNSDGATFTANAFGGGDLWVLSRVALNVEARYSWAKADLHDAFSDFERIDLRGWQWTAGITLRY
jgi:hypothetical protein